MILSSSVVAFVPWKSGESLGRDLLFCVANVVNDQFIHLLPLGILLYIISIAGFLKLFFSQELTFR